MSKNSIPSSLKTNDFSEDWNNHPAVEWLICNKKILLWAVTTLLALLILAYRLVAQRTLHVENDFFQAQAAFTKFQQEILSSEESPSAIPSLQQLETLMQHYPELKAKYEGSLAQMLLITGQTSQARTFAEDIFKRTQPDHLQLYQDYSKTSLLISEGQYAEALSQAQQLKQTMEQVGDEATNPNLYLLNLIRLAMLYQQLGHAQKELQVWEQFQNQPQYLEAMMAINQAFKSGQASLNQYIEERKHALD